MPWLPPWWDLLTFARLFGLTIFIGAWIATGYLFAPWLFDRFQDGTRGYVDWMVHTFDRMFITVSRRACILSILGSMLFSFFLGVFLTSGLPSGWGYVALRTFITTFLVFGPFGIPIGMSLPRKVVQMLWQQRLDKFENQMLDALSFMSNGLRSGLSLLQCMNMVIEELPNPIAEEFALVMSEQRVGVPFEDALNNLEKRIESEDLQILVTSINILRQAGGNLSETFQTIAYTVRERKKVQGRIRTLTAQGVSQAVIITIMPFALIAILYTLEPEMIGRLWTTWQGWVLLFFMMILQTVGGFIMARIVKIRV